MCCNLATTQPLWAGKAGIMSLSRHHEPAARCKAWQPCRPVTVMRIMHMVAILLSIRAHLAAGHAVRARRVEPHVENSTLMATQYVRLLVGQLLPRIGSWRDRRHAAGRCCSIAAPAAAGRACSLGCNLCYTCSSCCDTAEPYMCLHASLSDRFHETHAINCQSFANNNCVITNARRGLVRMYRRRRGQINTSDVVTS